MEYRRTRQAGGTYFFTVNAADRSCSLLLDHVENLRDAVRRAKRRYPFEIVAWVVMPDHLHAIWTLPEGDGDCGTRWMLIKSTFSRNIPGGERITAVRKRKRERGLWQRRFWEHLVTDDDDLRRHVDYIHINPVKHGFALRASDWPYSSIHRYASRGMLPLDWAASPDALQAGERRDVGLRSAQPNL